MSNISKALEVSDYLVVDDIFSEDNYKIIKDFFNKTTWVHTPETNDHSKMNATREELLQDYGFTRLLYSNNQSDDPMIAQMFLDNVKQVFDVHHLDRIKAGLFTPSESEILHWPHVDNALPHWTALYYFSTEEDAGHTYIYNQKFDPYMYKNPYEQWLQTKDKFEVQEKIQTKENRVVFFKGNVYHASSRPRNVFKRIAVNVNFFGHPKTDDS